MEKLMKKKYLALHLFSLLFLLPLLSSCDDQREVYIVYLDEHKSGERTTQEIEDSQHSYLLSVKSDEKDAKDSLLYSYKNNINGCAVLLTTDEASKLSEMEEVVSVFPSKQHTWSIQTTRLWNFLGLDEKDSNSNNYSTPTSNNALLHKANYGENVIVGMLDSGIWSESKSFGDEGMGPVPKSWKGICQTGDSFTFSYYNRKIMGARYYLKAYEASNDCHLTQNRCVTIILMSDGMQDIEMDELGVIMRYVSKDQVVTHLLPEDPTILQGKAAEMQLPLESEDVDIVVFTGSTTTGQTILELSAKSYLKQATLELGGKSLIIVGSNFNLKVGTRRMVSRELECNDGQACISPSLSLIRNEEILGAVEFCCRDDIVVKEEKKPPNSSSQPEEIYSIDVSNWVSIYTGSNLFLERNRYRILVVIWLLIYHLQCGRYKLSSMSLLYCQEYPLGVIFVPVGSTKLLNEEKGFSPVEKFLQAEFSPYEDITVVLQERANKNEKNMQEQMVTNRVGNYKRGYTILDTNRKDFLYIFYPTIIGNQRLFFSPSTGALLLKTLFDNTLDARRYVGDRRLEWWIPFRNGNEDKKLIPRT